MNLTFTLDLLSFNLLMKGVGKLSIEEGLGLFQGLQAAAQEQLTPKAPEKAPEAAQDAKQEAANV